LVDFVVEVLLLSPELEDEEEVSEVELDPVEDSLFEEERSPELLDEDDFFLASVA
jgi:hypothetical protein